MLTALASLLLHVIFPWAEVFQKALGWYRTKSNKTFFAVPISKMKFFLFSPFWLPQQRNGGHIQISFQFWHRNREKPSCLIWCSISLSARAYILHAAVLVDLLPLSAGIAHIYMYSTSHVSLYEYVWIIRYHYLFTNTHNCLPAFSKRVTVQGALKRGGVGKGKRRSHLNLFKFCIDLNKFRTITILSCVLNFTIVLRKRKRKWRHLQ